MTNTLKQLRLLIEQNNYNEALKIAESIFHIAENKILEQLINNIKIKDKIECINKLNFLEQIYQKPYTTENINLLGLQTTYQLLKTQLLVLTNQKAEAEKLIAQFRIQYYRQLGFLINEILTERLKLFEQLKDTNPDKQFEYKKTQEQFQQFSKQWEHVSKEQKSNIDEETRQRLTFVYRKASKLCHPDTVKEEMKEIAQKIFVELHKAYIENDIQTVEQILQQLEKGLLEPEELAVNNLEQYNSKLKALRDRTIDEIMKRVPFVKLNGDRYNRLPGNVNFSFEFIEGESLLLMLDMKGVAASSGSACSSGSLDPSHVLMAIGLPHEIAHGSLRISFGDAISSI